MGNDKLSTLIINSFLYNICFPANLWSWPETHWPGIIWMNCFSVTKSQVSVLPTVVTSVSWSMRWSCFWCLSSSSMGANCRNCPTKHCKEVPDLCRLSCDLTGSWRTARCHWKNFLRKWGVANVNLSKLKNGHVSAIRFSTLEAICEALDCQPGDILEYRKTEEEMS